MCYLYTRSTALPINAQADIVIHSGRGLKECSKNCTDATPPFFTVGDYAGITCKDLQGAIGPIPQHKKLPQLFLFPFKVTCTNNAGGWQANTYCQQSCADAGFNYADPPCCISPPPSPAPPPSH